MSPSGTVLGQQMERAQRNALFVGLIALLVSLIGLFMDPSHFWQSYLFAYIFWAGLALGCLGIFFLHNVVGGNWGVAIRRLVESGLKTLPLILLLAIPLFFALGTIYKWTDAGYRAEHFAVGHKAAYLNPTWFIIRTLLYFAIWLFSGFRILKMANEHDRTGDPALFKRIKARSAPALLVFVITTSLAFIDWIMSLESDWYSTIYGWMFTVGQVLLTFAFLVAVLVLLSKREPFASFLTRQHYHDLGNLMLAFTMLWAYMSFSQFLIIWAENLPDEIPWYVRRFSGGWGYIAWTISIFQFCVPFFLLLLRFVKKNPTRLRTLAVWIIIMRVAGCILDSCTGVASTRTRSLLDRYRRVDRLGRHLAGLLYQKPEGPAVASVERPPGHVFAAQSARARTLTWNTRYMQARMEPATSSARSAYG